MEGEIKLFFFGKSTYVLCTFVYYTIYVYQTLFQFSVAYFLIFLKNSTFLSLYIMPVKYGIIYVDSLATFIQFSFLEFFWVPNFRKLNMLVCSGKKNLLARTSKDKEVMFSPCHKDMITTKFKLSHSLLVLRRLLRKNFFL